MCVGLKNPGKTSVKRTSVFWEVSDELGQFGTHARCATIRIGPSSNRCDRALAIIKLPLRDSVEPYQKGIGRLHLREAYRRDEAQAGDEPEHHPIIGHGVVHAKTPRYIGPFSLRRIDSARKEAAGRDYAS